MGLLGRNKSKSPGREQVKVNASDRYNAMHDPPPPPPTPPPSTSSRRSRPSSRGSSSSRPRGNATSTAGYQYALQAYSKTVDPNENSNVNTMPSIVTSKNQSTANAFVRQSQLAQGTSVPASLLTSNGNINARATNAYSRGNANRNGNRNNASPPQETLNAVHGGACLTYSNSGSPDKTGYQHQQLNQQQQQDYNRHNSNYNNEYMQPQTQPQQQQPQPQPQHHLNINTNPNPILRSSSSMDDCGPSSDDDINPISPASSSSYSFPQYPGSPSTFLHQRKSNSKNHNHNHSHSNSFLPDYNYEPEMVDTTYAEHYGDAYTGKPIRYIYPQGYGSMRPRSRPWQIALVMFIALAWLNVYIVGHCADRFESQNYNDDQYQNANDNDNYNANDADDAAVIETKWCGNRNLYFTWVLSVALTGLSFAYCSIIGVSLFKLLSLTLQKASSFFMHSFSSFAILKQYHSTFFNSITVCQSEGFCGGEWEESAAWDGGEE
jgi:hypothetical protein